jgi:hypothetical protein
MIATADRISRKTVEKLLQFIKSILPTANHVPLNFSRLLKTIEPDENSIVSACKICCRPSLSEICDHVACQTKRQL